MLKVLKEDGQSMVEVIVTAIIFIIATVGIMSTLPVLTPKGKDVDKRITAAYIGKSVIESLRNSIDPTTWNDSTGPLATGIVHTIFKGSNNEYIVNYYLVDIPGTNVRQIFMNIYYPD